MRFRRASTCLLASLVGVLLASPVCLPCTSFVLEADRTLLFGSNYDNDIWPGLLYVNKRSVRKSGWEPGTTGSIAEWVSRYGSVTFNAAGYQLAWAGMNEKGLVLSTMALGTTECPVPDERPPLASPLWMQYLLDTCATVDEVIASDRIVRIKDTVDHYLVCDATGEAAVLEFLKGKMVVYRGESLPLGALANNTYPQSVSRWREGSPEGIEGKKSRVTRVAEKLSAFDPTSDTPPVTYVFEILDEVSSPPFTRWSIVFDIRSRVIHFKTFGNRKERLIDLRKLDYGCQTPARVMDAHADLEGDVTGDFEEIDPEYSLAQFLRFLQESEIEMPEEQVTGIMEVFLGFPCGTHGEQ